ncbi:PLDc_N domain-containing protein [Salinibacterium sp. NG253]|uniref:PLD nuclease N-terminal domain-containing protein n=1 Tax=Salinibacterium sp. NG253 TaxID=2792039 RepID=UPI0018CF4DB8|nr:PLD nuclease N-terminal domain-containing protein [Salinibacterium sp. NG253]MBH0115971.1 PLDc_N domain-containing protein [Salinibacterium sp. NG253]
MGSLISLAYFALLIAVLIDIILIDESRIKHLGKVTWIFLVIFMPFIGSILWFAIGREHQSTAPRYLPFGAPERREHQSSMRPSSTEEEIAKLDAEIEYFQRQEKIRALEDELRKRKQLP